MATTRKRGSMQWEACVRRKGIPTTSKTCQCVVQGIGHRSCSILQRSDGYGYSQIAFKGEAGEGAAQLPALSLPGLKAEVSRAIL